MLGCLICHPAPDGSDAELTQSAAAVMRYWPGLTPVEREIIVALVARWSIEVPPRSGLRVRAAGAGKRAVLLALAASPLLA